MHTESAFIAAIASAPDDDTPRLVFADWLEENGQAERAEFIRLSCRLDPDRDRFDDPAVNALRERVDHLLQPFKEAEGEWLRSVYEPLGHDWPLPVEWRRGFVDSLALPVQWIIQYGKPLRERYPLLRKLVVFRLNGWGERLAACEWLRGIPEIELACWYADADAAALANSPHLRDVERVVLYSGGDLQQARIFARAAAWPKLRELHLVSQGGPQAGWVEAVNEAAGRPIATVYDFGSELFPFAATFADCHGFLIGKLPDGTQLFALGGEDEPTAEGWLFHPDGRKREPFHFEFPPELVLPKETGPTDDWKARWDREERMRFARKGYLTEQTGFVPTFIRVEAFSLDDDGFCQPGRYRGDVEASWGVGDDPRVSPEEDELWAGFGGTICDAVRSGEFTFDFGNEWWCDRSGHVTST